MRKTIAVLTALGAMTWALPALAVPPPADAALTHGYDSDNSMLVFGVPLGDDEDCAITGETSYELDEDGNVVDYGVPEEEGTEESATDLENLSTDSVGDDTAEEDDPACVLTAVDVTGPNGQVNHGQVVRSFVHALKELGLRGNGCAVRAIAQSEYGKGDQQVRTSDVEDSEDGSTTEDSATLNRTVVLEAIVATCLAGSDDSDGNDRGRPDKAEKPEKAEKSENGNKPENTGKPEHANDDNANGNNGNGKGNNGNGRGNGKP